MIAIHAGAGFHAPEKAKIYQKCLETASLAAWESLCRGGGCLESIEAAMSALENDPCTNAGLGSNLTLDGQVELDSSVMSGSGDWAAVGAVKGLKNPSRVAIELLKESRNGPLSMGRVPPM